MSTPQSTAAVRGGTPDSRAKPRSSRSATEETVVVESLWGHAMRVLRSRLSAAAMAILDPGIALLLRLRKGAGGVQEAPDDGRPRDRLNSRHEAAAAPAEAMLVAPKPRRRFRNFLVYSSVLLVSIGSGGMLAYNLFAKLLDHQFAETRRLEEKITKHAKSTETIQKKLTEAQTKRTEAEKKLAVTIAEYKVATTEKQQKIDAMEKRLNLTLASERGPQSPLESPAHHRNTVVASSTSKTSRITGQVKAGEVKTGDCKLEGGNFSALKSCIEEFNR